ncbi:hypothetical protein HDU93_007961 [Gonapodya sp. JEL0774]|nr:hypothetical protein HDU93_007961 [Gonapodya sp. JEL0774]
MLAFHKSVSSSIETAPLCTIMGTRVPKDTASRYGCLVQDPSTKEILHYVEKPETFISDLINTGVYIFHPNVFQFMAQAVADRHMQMEREQFENNMYSLPTSRSVPDMGTLTHGSFGFPPSQPSYTPYHDYTYNYQSSSPLHTEADVVRLELDVLRGLAGTKSMFVFEINTKDDFWMQLKAAQSSLAANTMYLQYWSKTAPARLARFGGFGILGSGDQVDPFRGDRGRGGVFYHPVPPKDQPSLAQTPLTKALHASSRFDITEPAATAPGTSATDVRAESLAGRARGEAAAAALNHGSETTQPLALERSSSLVPGLNPSPPVSPSVASSPSHLKQPRPQPTHPTLIQPVIIHPTAYIHPTAKVGPNVTIGPRTVIHRGVRVHDAIVLEASEIRHDTIVLHSIIGRECKIGCWCRIEGDGVQAHTPEATPGGHKISATVLGKEVKVAEECVVRNCVVLPNKELGRSYQKKEVKIGSGKALVYKIGDEYRATSHICPHYKAPLIKGVLSQDGRIMCPWHGACFNTKTGDIEDGPSIDGLQSYETQVRGKSVYVKASEAAIAAGRRGLSDTVKISGDNATVVVIGGGAGGLQAVETLRSEGFKGRIQLLSREDTLPVDRPKLSKSLKTVLDAVQLRSKEHFDKIGVEVQLNVEVVGLDAKAKLLHLKDGRQVRYDYVVIASGGDPRRLPIPGSELGNIHVVRGVSDATGLDAAINVIQKERGADYRPKVVIVGSSFIGMEAAAVLAKTSDLTVIGMEKVPFERVLGPDVGKAFMIMHEKAGVKFRMESVTERYEASPSNPRLVGSVIIKGTNERLAADVVVLGVGVRPSTDFLKGSGIPLERDGSVMVEDTMGVPGVEGVFAVGDIARYTYHLTGEKIRVEHWSVAQNQGRVAAQNILKIINSARSGVTPELTPFKTVPFFWTVQFGKSVRYSGHAESFDEVITKFTPSLEDMETLEAYYVRQNKVIAVATVARDPIAATSSELIRLGLMPSGTEIKNGKDVTKIKLGCELCQSIDQSQESLILFHGCEIEASPVSKAVSTGPSELPQWLIPAAIVVAIAIGFSLYMSSK